MKIYMTRVFNEGDRIPWWLGLAYWEWGMNVAVCFPIPLNLIVRWARDGYFWIKATRHPGWLDNQRAEAYNAGFGRGVAAGAWVGERRMRARLDYVQARLDEWLGQ